MLNSPLVTMNDVSLEVRVEVSWIAKNFQKAAHSLLCFILSFLLDVDS